MESRRRLTKWRHVYSGTLLIIAVPAYGQRVVVLDPSSASVVAHDEPIDPRVKLIAARYVHLEGHNIPLRAALEELAKQAKINLFFDASAVPEDRRITVHLSRCAAIDAFRHVLAGTGLDIVIHGTGQAALVRQEDVTHMANQTSPQTGSASEPGPRVILSDVITVAQSASQQASIDNGHTLNADSIMHVTPFRSVTELIATRIAGLTTANMSGTPGDPVRVNLRGGNLSGLDNPMVFVDGVQVYAGQSGIQNSSLARSGLDKVFYVVPSSLDQIDPNSIDSLEVLQGPSAIAMYGSDAANGVIRITTKRGQRNKTQWTGTVIQGMTAESGVWPSVESQTGSYAASQIANDLPGTLAGSGSTRDASTHVSGGMYGLTYAMTASARHDIGLLTLPDAEVRQYMQAQGVSPMDWMKRPDKYDTRGISAALTTALIPHVTLTGTSSLFRSEQQRSSLETATYGFQNFPESTSPLTELLQGYTELAKSSASTLTNGIGADWQAASWLPVTANIGYDRKKRIDQTYIPFEVDSVISLALADTLGHAGSGIGLTQVWTFNGGTYRAVIDSAVTFAAGINAYHAADSTIRYASSDNGVSAVLYNVQQQTTSMQSVYIQPTFSVLHDLSLAPGVRVEGGQVNGHQMSEAVLPTLAVSYAAIHPEHPWGPLIALRPRLSYGQARILPPVASLSPEHSNVLDGELETEWWNGRMIASYARYTDTRTNTIVDLDPFVEPDTIRILYAEFQSIGTVRNSGQDVSLTLRPLSNRVIQWDLNTTITENRSRLVHNSLLEPLDAQLADSLIDVGPPTPEHVINLLNDFTLLRGRLHFNTTVAILSGFSNIASAYGIVKDSNEIYPKRIVQFQDLTLTYDMPREFSSHLHLEGAHVTLQGNNLRTSFSHLSYASYSGNATTLQSTLTPATLSESPMTGQIPQPRTWRLRVGWEM